MADKRIISERQEAAYRYVSHDFDCLTVEEAAKKMGITASAVSQLLKSMEAVAHQLFPLLTRQERDVLEMLESNLTVKQIAPAVKLTERQVHRIVDSLTEKKKWFPGSPAKTVSYSPAMERHVVKKF